MPTIACPLSGCESEHELRHAKNKSATPYITCSEWGNSTVWFRSPAANDFLNANNGGRENYATPKTRRTNPVPKQMDEMDRFLADDVPPEEKEARENPQDIGEVTDEAKLREFEENKLKLEMWRRINEPGE